MVKLKNTLENQTILWYITKYFKVTNYQKLIPSGSHYKNSMILPKYVKTNMPQRPVVAMVETPEYELVKLFRQSDISIH